MKLTIEEKLLLSIVREGFEPLMDSVCTDELNWDKFIICARGNRLLPRISKSISTIAPDNIKEKLNNELEIYKKYIDATLNIISSINEECKKNELSFIIFKGIALSNTIYGNSYDHYFGDIDLIVEKDELLFMDWILKKLGFQQYSNRKYEKFMEKKIEFLTYNHYNANHVYPYFNVLDNITIKIELHTQIYSIPNQLLKNMLWEIRLLDINSECYPTFNDEMTLLVLFIHTYENSENIFSVLSSGKINLRDYTDLYYFYLNNTMGFNWNNFIQIIKNYNLNEKINIVLNNFFEIYPDSDFYSELSPLTLSGISMWICQVPFIERLFHGQNRRDEATRKIKQCIDKSTFNQFNIECRSENKNKVTIVESEKKNSMVVTIEKISKFIKINIKVPSIMLKRYSHYILRFEFVNSSDQLDYLITYLNIDIGLASAKYKNVSSFIQGPIPSNVKNEVPVNWKHNCAELYFPVSIISFKNSPILLKIDFFKKVAPTVYHTTNDYNFEYYRIIFK